MRKNYLKKWFYHGERTSWTKWSKSDTKNEIRYTRVCISAGLATQWIFHYINSCSIGGAFGGCVEINRSVIVEVREMVKIGHYNSKFWHFKKKIYCNNGLLKEPLIPLVCRKNEGNQTKIVEVREFQNQKSKFWKFFCKIWKFFKSWLLGCAF